MSWKKVKLGDFLKVRDNRFKPNDKAISHLRRIEKIDFSGAIFISDKPSNTDMILIKKGDLVISGINVEKGAMAVYTGDEDITATIHYSSYSFDEKEIDIEFLKFFLKSIEFKNALKEQVPGGIKTEIKPKHLLPLVVLIPTDIKDQKEVVDILKSRNSKVDAISTELTHQLTLVKKLRQQLLQDAVQGKLVEQNPTDEPASELLKKIKAEKEKLIAEKKIKKEKELPSIKPEEIPFEIPDNWVWCRLGEIVDIQTGIALGKRFAGELKQFPYLRVANVQRGSLNLTTIKFLDLPNEIASKYLLKKEDILVNEGGDFDKVGRCAVWEAQIYPCIHQNHLFAVRPISSNPYFLEFIINSDSSREYFLGKYKKLTNLASLNKSNLTLLPIPLPPLSQQNRIVQKLDELMQYCNELEASIKQSESQNEKLLQQVLKEALRKEPVGV